MPDYTFYVEDYLGEDIPEKEFPRFIRRAGDELRRMREMYAVAPRQGLDPELAESMALWLTQCTSSRRRTKPGALRR